MNWIRAALFMLFALLWTAFYGLLAIILPLLPVSPKTRHRIITLGWTRGMATLIEKILGIRYRVEGLENIPQTACVLMSKHQSAWETILLQVIFPPMCFVMKKELLNIPFLGWGFRSIMKIAIDRRAGKDALTQVIEQGTQLLQQGYWIAIFPEGTRVAPGEKHRYKQGGAALACAAQVPVVPVAHNAGEFWPRQAFLKRPGEVLVIIGTPISPVGQTPERLTQAVQNWIEGEMQHRFPHHYRA